MMKQLNHSSIIWKINSLLLLVLLFGCYKSEKITDMKLDSDLPDQEADSVYVLVMNGDFKESELFATHMDIYQNKKQKKTFADSVIYKTYKKNGILKSTLTCDAAEIDDIKDIIIAKGNVIIKTENSLLKTEHLIFNRNNEKIHAPGEVVLIREEDKMEGINLKTDANFDTVELEEVTAQGKVNEEDFN